MKWINSIEILIWARVVDWLSDIRNILIQLKGTANTNIQNLLLIVPQSVKMRYGFYRKSLWWLWVAKTLHTLQISKYVNTRITFSRSPKGGYASRSTNVFKNRNLNMQLEENLVNKIFHTHVCSKRLCLAEFQTHYQKAQKS